MIGKYANIPIKILNVPHKLGQSIITQSWEPKYGTSTTRARSWILTKQNVRILRKKALFLDFVESVKSIQTTGYNGARTVYVVRYWGS